MAIAQRMRQPAPAPVLAAIGLIALVLGIAALMYTWSSAPTTPSVGYSQFLGDIEKGQLSQVVQIGTTLEATGRMASTR